MMTGMVEREQKFGPSLLFPPGGGRCLSPVGGSLWSPHLCKLSAWNTQSCKLGHRDTNRLARGLLVGLADSNTSDISDKFEQFTISMFFVKEGNEIWESHQMLKSLQG